MHLLKRLGILGVAFGLLLSMTAKAEAAAFTFDFCPGGSGCPTGMTVARLTFTENLATPDTNDYALAVTFTTNNTAAANLLLDAFSFAINNGQPVPTPGGYTSINGTPPAAGSNPFTANGATWLISFDNINNNDCGNAAQANEVCVESTSPAGG